LTPVREMLQIHEFHFAIKNNKMSFITWMPAPPKKYMQSFLEDMRKDSAKKAAKKADKTEKKRFWPEFLNFWRVNHRIRVNHQIGINRSLENIKKS